MQFVITEAQQQAFRRASHDENPLHWDAHHARRSPYGRPVCYGMAAVLRALVLACGDRPTRLRSLRCDFRKALFPDTGYRLDIEERGEERRLRIGRGPVDHLRVVIEAVPWDGSAEPAGSTGPAGSAVPAGSAGSRPPAPVTFQPRTEAAEEPQGLARRIHYAVDPAALSALAQAFECRPGAFPAQQLTMLLWLSYHVGMEMPGRQALFADARIRFGERPVDAPALDLELAAASFDERFNRYSLTGQGPGVEQLALSAFRRPPPVVAAGQELPRLAPGERPLAGKQVLVTGAARGFGAALARLCALAGARVLVHHRGEPADIEALCADIRASGQQATVVHADLGQPEAASALREAAAAVGGLDVVFCNAAPGIPENRFLEQEDAEILEFTRRNLAMTLATARGTLPALRPGARFVQVSTRYLDTPPEGFSHYLAAKSAQEGLLMGLAQEFRGVEFVIARLPRMLTDQTNLPFALSRSAAPGDVALALIRRLGEKSEDPGATHLRRLDFPP